MAETLTLRQAAPVRWAKVVDHTRCIGCHACSTACKSENQVPIGVQRTYVKYVDVGRFPQARRAFQVTRCNQPGGPVRREMQLLRAAARHRPRARVRRGLPDGGDPRR
jgi:ferredoxin